MIDVYILCIIYSNRFQVYWGKKVIDGDKLDETINYRIMVVQGGCCSMAQIAVCNFPVKTTSKRKLFWKEEGGNSAAVGTYCELKSKWER